MIWVGLTRAGVRVTVRFYHGDTWITLHEGKPHDRFNHKSLLEKFAAFKQQYNTSIITRIRVPWSEKHLASEAPTLLITSDCHQDASFLCNLLRPASEPTTDTTADAPRSIRDPASHQPRPSHRTVRLEHYNDGQPRGPASEEATAAPAPMPTAGTGSDPTPAEFGDDCETREIMLTTFMEANQSNAAPVFENAAPQSNDVPPVPESVTTLSNATTIIPQSNPTPPASEITVPPPYC